MERSSEVFVLSRQQMTAPLVSVWITLLTLLSAQLIGWKDAWILKLGKEKMTLNKPKKKPSDGRERRRFLFSPRLVSVWLPAQRVAHAADLRPRGETLSACVFISDRGFFYFLKELLNSSRFVFKVTLQLLSTSEQRLVKNVSENCF